MITKKRLVMICAFLFLGFLLIGNFNESNLVEASTSGLNGKHANLCSNSYRTAWGYSEGSSGESCDDAYYLAMVGAQQACIGSLMNQPCPYANFCSPSGIPNFTGLEYGPCAATYLQGEPPKYTATMYAFCNQKCG